MIQNFYLSHFLASPLVIYICFYNLLLLLKMLSLRRAAFRFIKSPSVTIITKPRPITTINQSVFRPNRQVPSLIFQRRWASEDVQQNNTSSTAEEPAQQTETLTEGRQAQSQSTLDTQPTPTPAEEQSYSFRFQEGPTLVSRKFPPPDPKETIYVGNLFFDVTAEDLKNEMQRFGPVSSARIVYDSRGLSRGFAYVRFETMGGAKAAVENMHMTIFEGRRVIVQFAQGSLVNGRDKDFKPNPPSKTLFIGNMSFDMTDRDLNDLFKNIRNVIDVRVAVDRRTGQPRGFAHAEFIDVASAQAAYDILEGKAPYGRKLRLDYSYSNRSQGGVGGDSGSSGEGV